MCRVLPRSLRRQIARIDGGAVSNRSSANGRLTLIAWLATQGTDNEGDRTHVVFNSEDDDEAKNDKPEDNNVEERRAAMK